MTQTWMLLPGSGGRRPHCLFLYIAYVLLRDVCRLCNDIVAKEYTREDSFVLTNGTWCPFNSQNTSYHRSVIPAYFLSPTIGRMDDIWASYVLTRCMHHLGHVVRFGHPLVTQVSCLPHTHGAALTPICLPSQDRNPHNFMVDHEKERIGLESGGKLCSILQSIPLAPRQNTDLSEQAYLEVEL